MTAAVESELRSKFRQLRERLDGLQQLGDRATSTTLKRNVFAGAIPLPGGGGPIPWRGW